MISLTTWIRQESNHYIWPHWLMLIGSLGLLFDPIGTFSIFLTISNPSMTRPKTTCLLSRKLHLAQVMKNWHPLVSFPLFAIDNKPAASCLSVKFSSGNALPLYMLIIPVPSLWTKSPPWIMKSFITRWKLAPLYLKREFYLKTLLNWNVHLWLPHRNSPRFIFPNTELSEVFGRLWSDISKKFENDSSDFCISYTDIQENLRFYEQRKIVISAENVYVLSCHGYFYLLLDYLDVSIDFEFEPTSAW